MRQHEVKSTTFVILCMANNLKKSKFKPQALKFKVSFNFKAISCEKNSHIKCKFRKNHDEKA